MEYIPTPCPLPVMSNLSDEEILSTAIYFGIGAAPLLRGHVFDHLSTDERIVSFVRLMIRSTCAPMPKEGE